MKNWTRRLKNIPTQIKIKRVVYPVLWVTNFQKDIMGETRFHPKQIVLANNYISGKSITDKEKVMTAYHEYIHALSEEYDINLTEKQVHAFEQTFLSMLSFMKEIDK